MSSITKKQIVAVTGLLLILFVISHLAGNLLIYGGPRVFNGYVEFLDGLRPAFNLVEYALLLVFVVHICTTALVVFENWPRLDLMRRDPVGLLAFFFHLARDFQVAQIGREAQDESLFLGIVLVRAGHDRIVSMIDGLDLNDGLRMRLLAVVTGPFSVRSFYL